jgi:hypothetical protein
LIIVAELGFAHLEDTRAPATVSQE